MQLNNYENIHIIPTEKPSRLFLNKVNKKLLLEDISNPNLKKVLPSGSYQNIYITSDEEIKENTKPCWCLDTKYNSVNYYQGALPLYNYIGYKKIILTDNQDLIKDGVQAIDNEFLEWFVKNPSCEFVEVENTYFTGLDRNFVGYKIIIPKEEPKQETLEEFINHSDTPDGYDQYTYDEGIRVGAKWQAERMYSEEEVIDSIKYTIDNFFNGKIAGLNSKEIFEQFKKK
jgi:hypothetical protein